MPPTNSQPVGNILKGNAAINKAVAAHKNDEIKEGFQDLPGGIVNGTAQVTMCKFGIYAQGTKHAGKPYFMAQASVLTPAKHGDMKIQGLFTKIGPEPICDTPENKTSSAKNPRLTTDDHVAWVVQMLGRMGVDPSTLTDGASLEIAAAQVQEAQPVIVFKTTEGKVQLETTGPRKGQPKLDPKTGQPFTPRIFHDWIRLAEEQGGETSGPGAGVSDQGGGDEGGGDDATAAAGDEEPNANPDGAGDAEVTDYSGEDDLDVLVAASDQDGENNGTAQDRMIELAVEAGIDKDAAEGAESWEALKTMIEEARAAAEEPQAPEIKKGSSVRYTVTEGKPPKKKTVDATVLALKDGKADIKRQDTKAVIKGVALDKLATA